MHVVRQPLNQLQSQGATSQKSERAKGRARRAARVGKSRTKMAVSKASRGPEHTTSPRSDRTQSATLPNDSTSATQVSPSQGDSMTPATHVGSSSETLLAVPPFTWATATAIQISRLPELQGIPDKLLKAVLPELRVFLEGYGGDTHISAPATDHEQDPLPPFAQPVESPLPTTQPRPPPLTEQLETALPMAEQNYELGGFNGWEEFMRL